MRCPRRSTNRSKDRRQLLRRFDYLATFHRHATSFTTASSSPPSPPPPPPPLPPPPSSEALWQRSSLGRYRFPPIALSNSIVSEDFPSLSPKLMILMFTYRDTAVCYCNVLDLSGLLGSRKTSLRLRFVSSPEGANPPTPETARDVNKRAKEKK